MEGKRMSDRTNPGRAAVGCLVLAVCVWIELSVFLGIATTVAEWLGPALRARGYNTKIGAGFLIAVGLGCIMAIYPTLWTHRLGRRIRRRL
jgi:hypothetical protein